MLYLLLTLWGRSPSKCGHFVYVKKTSICVRKGPRPNKYNASYILTAPRYPLKVIREYYYWKQVADHEGVLGWIHKSFLKSDKRYGVTLSACKLTQKDTNHAVAEIPKGFIVELLHKVDKNWFVLLKDPTDSKKLTGLVPCSCIWGE